MVAPTVKLNNGYEMPLVGFGLWKVNNDTCADQVYNAIKAGYRLFDGACGMSPKPQTTGRKRKKERN
jgi:D-xylose reductase